MPVEPPKAMPCVVKQRMVDQLLQAVTAITSLQDAETQNIIGGGPGLARISIALSAARQRWREARDEYTQHVLEHGC